MLLCRGEKYLLFHLDKRWELFPLIVRENLKKKLISLANNSKIVITSNIGSNNFFDNIKKELINIKNIQFIDEPNLHNILSLVYFSDTCISSHSGLIVHSGAAFKKNIIDLVSPNINDELDRWIPFNINYKRFDINNFDNNEFF